LEHAIELMQRSADGTTSAAAEARLVLAVLGIGPKAKKDLRWLTENEAEQAAPKLAVVEPLIDSYKRRLGVEQPGQPKASTSPADQTTDVELQAPEVVEADPELEDAPMADTDPTGPTDPVPSPPRRRDYRPEPSPSSGSVVDEYKRRLGADTSTTSSAPEVEEDQAAEPVREVHGWAVGAGWKGHRYSPGVQPTRCQTEAQGQAPEADPEQVEVPRSLLSEPEALEAARSLLDRPDSTTVARRRLMGLEDDPVV
jgi:hypothetical protein